MYTIYADKIDNEWFAIAYNDNESVAASNFSSRGRRDVIANVVGSLPINSTFKETKPEGPALEVLRKIHFIYKGEPVEHEFKLDMEKLPPFTKSVLQITYRIPHGLVTTYGRIAKMLGNANAQRAVGNAEARNPFVLIVPCHRVVGSDLTLRGYGSGGLDVKHAILEREGVTIIGKYVSKKNLWEPKL